MRDLTKWPLLIVVGDDVTRVQANEILVRTNNWFLMGNDGQWEKAVYTAVGIGVRRDGFRSVMPDDTSLREFERRCGVIDLHYLCNEQIYSAWIGGPHGWCDWDGRVGCSTWNIGKWPSVDEVTEDWRKIAEAFPYLNLRAQVIPDEGEAGQPPAAEWTVADGEVTLNSKPTERLTPKRVEEDPLETFVRSLSVYGRERGVTIDRLAEAVRQVRS